MAESNPDIKKAVELLEIISQDKETRAIYLAREMVLRDEISRIEESKNEIINLLDVTIKLVEKACTLYSIEKVFHSEPLFLRWFSKYKGGMWRWKRKGKRRGREKSQRTSL